MQKNKVVYSHSINGVIFYIGCGTESRPYEQRGRNKNWRKTVKGNGGIYDIKILSSFLKKEDAFAEESKLIKFLLPECNIVGIIRKKTTKTVQFVLDDKLLKQIASNAESNERTLSGEVRYILNQYYYNKGKK